MNQKKGTIGVATLHFKNRNYGCALQAYALHKQLERLGYSSELINFSKKDQIQSSNENMEIGFSRVFSYSLFEIVKKILRRIVIMLKRIVDKFRKKHFVKSRALRHQSFDEFEQRFIPQTDIIYTEDNIEETLQKYDFFVCGSDQIWNPRWYNAFYRLDFVPEEYPKFSYAASISTDVLTGEEKDVFKNTLTSYIGVSVREKQAVSLLEDLSPVTPVHALDPTLLLDATTWDEIATERIVKEPYVFCYFLGCGEELRKLAKQYSKKKNIRVVCIPYVLNRYHKLDKKYSDKFIEAASPADFISLIKYAEVIFTDSFHATVFSLIYEKEFFVFRRYGFPGMSARIETLTQMFGTEERFCDTDEKESVEYIEKCCRIDYSNKQEFEDLKEQSIAYLTEMLKKSEEKVNK